MPAKSSSSGGAGARAIEAGRAFVRIFADDSQLRKALDGIKAKLTGLGSFIGRTGRGLGIAGGLLLAPITALFKGAVDNAAQLDDLADAFNTTTESLSPLAYAFKVAGLGLEDLEKAMKEVAKNDASGRPLEDVLTEWALALNGIEDPGERARKALDQFGKAGLKIASIAPDLERLMKGAPIISSEDAKSAEQFQQAIAATSADLQGALLPVIKDLVPGVKTITKAIRENRDVVKIIGAIAVGLVAVGGALAIIGPIVGAAGASVGVLAAALSFALSPAGLLTGAISGLSVAWITQTKEGEKFAGEVSELFRGMGETAVEAWKGIAAAVRAGDLELALQIAGAGLKVEWLKLISFLTEKWVAFKNTFVDGWHDIVTAARITQNNLSASIGKGLLDIADAFIPGDSSVAEELKRHIDEEARAVNSDFLDDRIRRQREADAARRRQIDESIREAEAAQAKFKEVVGRAPSQLPQSEGSPIGKIQDLSVALPNAVKGMFDSPNFARSLGIGDSIAKDALAAAKEQVKVQHEIQNEVQVIAAAAVEVPDVLEEINRKFDEAARQPLVFQ